MKDYAPEVFTKDGLNDLGIYELRDLARDLGVVSPTSKEKQTIIEEILQIIYGLNYEDIESLIAGRPMKYHSETEWLDVFSKGTNGEVKYPKLDRTFDGARASVASNVKPYVNDADKENKKQKFGIIEVNNFVVGISTFHSTDLPKFIPLDDEFLEKNSIALGDTIRFNFENGKVVSVKKLDL